MREVKTEKPKKSFLLKAGLLCLVAYFSYVLITQQIAIGEKRQQLDALNDQIKVQEMRNSELEHIVSNNQSGNDTYREAEARQRIGLCQIWRASFCEYCGRLMSFVKSVGFSLSNPLSINRKCRRQFGFYAA